jgi:hypothetical protein
MTITQSPRGSLARTMRRLEIENRPEAFFNRCRAAISMLEHCWW